jgi:hypothetical protein
LIARGERLWTLESNQQARAVVGIGGQSDIPFK